MAWAGRDDVSQLKLLEAHGVTGGEKNVEIIEAMLNPHGGQGWFHEIASSQAYYTTFRFIVPMTQHASRLRLIGQLG